MEVIKLKDFNENMGVLIDVRHPIEYQNNHHISAINIYADKLIINHQKLLKKDKKYYLYCNQGHLSRKVINILKPYNYDLNIVLN